MRPPSASEYHASWLKEHEQRAKRKRIISGILAVIAGGLVLGCVVAFIIACWRADPVSVLEVGDDVVRVQPWVILFTAFLALARVTSR